MGLMTERQIAIEWKGGKPKGHISLTDGRLLSLKISRGRGSVENDNQFSSSEDSPFRLEVSLLGTEGKHGPGATIVSVGTETQAFSFFLRDVNDQSPIFIPEYGVAVTTADDLRSYSELEQATPQPRTSNPPSAD